MQTFERTITLDDKQARYYDLFVLQGIKNTSRTAAHFYGGNGFTTGVYLPLLTELSAQFATTSLAMRGYWHDLTSVKKLTREQDADILIDFLEKTRQPYRRYWAFSRRYRYCHRRSQTSRTVLRALFDRACDFYQIANPHDERCA